MIRDSLTKSLGTILTLLSFILFLALTDHPVFKWIGATGLIVGIVLLMISRFKDQANKSTPLTS